MKAKRIVVIPKKYQTHKRCEAMLKSTDQNRRCSHKEKSNGLCGLHLKSSSVVRWYDFIDDEQLELVFNRARWCWCSICSLEEAKRETRKRKITKLNNIEE